MFRSIKKANFNSISVSTLTTSALLLASLIASSRAMAQDVQKDGGQIGLAVVSTYEYMGSDQTRSQVVPVGDYEWANGWFAGVNGVGHKWTFGEQLQAGVKVTYGAGREESRSSALKGMGDIDASAELGGFMQYALGGGLAAKTSLRAGSGVSNKGALWDLGLQFGSSVGADWRFGAEVSATYANKDYMQSFFGVTAKQAQASGYGVYAPSAGLRDLGASVSLTYIVTPKVSLTGVISSTSLKGDAKNAPMVKRDSATSGIVALTYAL